MDDSLEGGAYIKHVTTAQRVVIGCNETGYSFELRCERGSWTGQRRNCSEPFTSKSSLLGHKNKRRQWGCYCWKSLMMSSRFDAIHDYDGRTDGLYCRGKYRVIYGLVFESYIDNFWRHPQTQAKQELWPPGSADTLCARPSLMTQVQWSYYRCSRCIVCAADARSVCDSWISCQRIKNVTLKYM